MLIASKYEEIYAPEVKDFVYIADKAFSKEEILLMERDILRELDFGLTAPSILRFLERYAHIAQIDTRQFLLGRYLIELTLTEYKMLRYTPSLIAASVVYLTNKIMKRELAWPQIMSELKACAKDLCMLLQGAEKCCLQSVRKKFALEAYGEVSKISIGSITSPMRR
jgi:cyclin B